MSLLDAVIAGKLGRANGDSGGEIDVSVSGASPTISPNDRTLYICGELTSLTLSGLPASGLFEIVFKSGSTATEVTLPANVLLPDGVSVEADTIYDISVRVCAVAGTTYGLAAMQGWQVPGA